VYQMPFRWQINASSVGKLIGAFKLKNDPESKRSDYQREALAKTWALNLKRMPRFGVQPSTTIQRELAKRQKTETTDESVQKVLENSVQMKTLVRDAVAGNMNQKAAIQAIEQTAKTSAKDAEAAATKAVEHTARAAEKVMKHRIQAQTTHVMLSFNTVKSGVKKTRAIGWFFVERGDEQHVYRMSPTGKSARKSTVEKARLKGWILPKTMKTLQEKVKEATVAFEASKVTQLRKVAVAEEKASVAQNIRKVATSAIQTTKGIQAEDKDLKKVQQSRPSVREGNRKAHFHSIYGRPFGAFIIGYIDGFDTKTGTVIELKHRTRGLFRELREYERVQCFVYMKMLKVKRAKLVETYGDEQREYVIEWDDATWRRIEQSIVQVVRDLNRAEQDVELRNELIAEIM
jgi:hypothetical protein